MTAIILITDGRKKTQKKNSKSNVLTHEVRTVPLPDIVAEDLILFSGRTNEGSAHSSSVVLTAQSMGLTEQTTR